MSKYKKNHLKGISHSDLEKLRLALSNKHMLMSAVSLYPSLHSLTDMCQLTIIERMCKQH